MFAYQCVTAYEGTRYKGWQKQGNTANTIQAKIEDILSRMLKEPIEITGSGRTDAGVHALGQVFHFHCTKDLFADSTHQEFLTKLNHYLPKDIRILAIESCGLRFHARLNAVQKTYQYRIDTSPYGNLFLRDTAHHVSAPMDIDAIKKGAALLLGTHDFKSFCSNKRMKKSSIRTIYDIEITWKPEQQLLFFTFTGNGFLYNMVRILSGTLIEIGLGLRAPEDIPGILAGCNRALAGHTAPANGLFLVSVRYT
ncbi:MAG: tRNA pseudouridine(38-40) synthase TruA [Bacteroidales bacterium]|nr:tRNA pseudouridine(38-40) synthase TruA [Clostridium sp.]MCM1203709.1 tRNA pseudouridine(38-40) synthase TruA [Bacteroidales bacterium]